MSETTYRFAPHPSGGIILGLRASQLAGLIAGGLGTLGALRAGGIASIGLALLVVAATAGTVLVPLRGQTLEQWAPTIARFAIAGFSGARAFAASARSSATSSTCQTADSTRNRPLPPRATPVRARRRRAVRGCARPL